MSYQALLAGTKSYNRYRDSFAGNEKVKETKLLRHTVTNDEILDMCKVQPLKMSGSDSIFMLNCFTLLTSPIGSGKTNMLSHAVVIYKDNVKHLNLYFFIDHSGPDETFNSFLNAYNMRNPANPINIKYINNDTSPNGVICSFLSAYEIEKRESVELCKVFNSIIQRPLTNEEHNAKVNELFLRGVSMIDAEYMSSTMMKYETTVSSYILEERYGKYLNELSVDSPVKKLEYAEWVMSKVNRASNSSMLTMPTGSVIEIYPTLYIERKNNYTDLVAELPLKAYPIHDFFIIDDFSKFPQLTKLVCDRVFEPLAQNCRHFLATFWLCGQRWGMLSTSLKQSIIQVHGLGYNISARELYTQQNSINKELSTMTKTGDQIVSSYVDKIKPYSFLFVNKLMDRVELIK
jgi:hypothetical protein